MRAITTHKVEGAADGLEILVEETLGPGGAPHLYQVFNGSKMIEQIDFQKGGIKEAGVNGMTHEVLLAIVIDRLEMFQKGPFPCSENARALVHCGLALGELKKRTEDRVKREVEGQSKA